MSHRTKSGPPVRKHIGAGNISALMYPNFRVSSYFFRFLLPLFTDLHYQHQQIRPFICTITASHIASIVHPFCFYLVSHYTTDEFTHLVPFASQLSSIRNKHSGFNSTSVLSIMHQTRPVHISTSHNQNRSATDNHLPLRSASMQDLLPYLMIAKHLISVSFI